MFQQLLQRLQHCNHVSERIGHASHTELQQLKEQLSEQMGKPVGWHTLGLPAAISTLGHSEFRYPPAVAGLYRNDRVKSSPAAGVYLGSVNFVDICCCKCRNDVYDRQRQYYGGQNAPGTLRH